MPGLADYIEAPFSQGSALARAYPGGGSSVDNQLAQQGVCLCLSAQWISRHKNFRSEVPKERVAFINQDKSIVDAMQAQIVFSTTSLAIGVLLTEARGLIATTAAEARANAPRAAEIRAQVQNLMANRGTMNKDNFAKAFKLFDLTLGDTLLNAVALTALTLEQRIADIVTHAGSTHTYCLLNLSNGNKGHGIATYKSGGGLLSPSHLYIFDPNLGELKVKSSEAKDVIRLLLQKYIQAMGADNVTVTRII